MRFVLNLLMVLVFSLTVCTSLAAQSPKKAAEKYYRAGEYKKAYDQYNLIKNIDKDKTLLAKRGISSYHINKLIEGSKDLTTSYQMGNTHPELKYYMGRINHSMRNYEDAIFFYKSYLRELKPSDEIRPDVAMAIKNCFAGLRYDYNDESMGLVENAGEIVNSIDDEINPVPSPTFVNRYYFSSNRAQDNYDLFSAEQLEGKWQHAHLIHSSLNTEKNELLQDCSLDGSVMVFLRGDEAGSNRLYLNRFSESKHNQRVVFSETKAVSGDKDVYLVNDEIMIFASNREGGYGGYDLYLSSFTANGWTKPVNLGPKINSTYNERYPFLNESQDQIFFSSDNANSIGGYDIFSAKKDVEEWGDIITYNFPLNSPEDDIQFRIQEEGFQAYIASNRKTSTYGGFDIFTVFLRQGYEVHTSEVKPPLDLIQSSVKDEDYAYEDDIENVAEEMAVSNKDEEREIDEKKIEEERLAAEKLKAEQKKEEERIAAEKKEEERVAAEKKEEERMAAEKLAEEKKIEEKKIEEERLAAEKLKAEQKKEEERIATEKKEEARVAAEKKEEERMAAEKLAEEKKIEEKKIEEERLAAEKLKAEQKKEEERIAAEKKEEERVATEKKEEERMAAEKLAEQKKIEEKKIEEERLAAEKLKAEQKKEEERIAADKKEEERVAAEKKEEERTAREKKEREQVEAKKKEEERIAADKKEEERIAAEKLAAEKRETDRIEAEKKKKDRIAADKKEEERIAAEKLLVEKKMEEDRIAAELEEEKKLEDESVAVEKSKKKSKKNKKANKQTDVTLINLDAIIYETDMDVMSVGNKKIIDNNIEKLKNTADSKIILTTYSLQEGLPEFELMFCIKRAEKIASYMIDNGIAKERLILKGVGSSYPYVKKLVDEVEDKKNKGYNNRVDIKLTDVSKTSEVIHPEVDPKYLSSKYEIYQTVTEDVYFRVFVHETEKKMYKNAILRYYNDLLIEHDLSKGMYNYYVGLYTDFKSTFELKRELENRNIQGVKIVAFYKGNILNASDAKFLQDDYPELSNFIEINQ